MYCPRINHFVRLHSSGNLGRCGHMVNITVPFKTLKELEQSNWLKGIKDKMAKDIWPDEYRKGDLHPLPRAHYHWVKDVMFKSDIKCPEEEYRKINVWKTGNLK